MTENLNCQCCQNNFSKTPHGWSPPLLEGHHHLEHGFFIVYQKCTQKSMCFSIRSVTPLHVVPSGSEVTQSCWLQRTQSHDFQNSLQLTSAVNPGGTFHFWKEPHKRNLIEIYISLGIPPDDNYLLQVIKIMYQTVLNNLFAKIEQQISV